MLYHPAHIATNIATLSKVVGGKVVLGLSRGAFYEYLSIRIKKPLRAVKEAVETIDLLLHSGGKYEGSLFKVSSKTHLKVHAYPDVETYVGTSGPKMIRMASGLKPVRGIIVDNMWNPRYVPKVQESIRIGALRKGRKPEDIDIIPRPFCCVMKDREEAKKIMVKELAKYLPFLVANSPMLAEAGISFKELEDFALHSEERGELAIKIVENF